MSWSDFAKAPGLENKLSIAAIAAFNNNFKKYVDNKSLPYIYKSVIYYILDVEKALYSSGLMTLLWSEDAIQIHMDEDSKERLEQEHVRERHLLWDEIIQGVSQGKCIVELIQARNRCAILSKAEHARLASRHDRDEHKKNPIKLLLKKNIKFCSPVWDKNKLIGGKTLSEAKVRKWFK